MKLILLFALFCAGCGDDIPDPVIYHGDRLCSHSVKPPCKKTP